MLDENINQPQSSTGDQPSEEPKTIPETPPLGPSEEAPPGPEPIPETPTPSTPAPEPSIPIPPTDEPPPTTIVSAPPEKKSRLKLIAGIVVLILLLASIPAAVYLVQQRQEIRKEAEGTRAEAEPPILPVIGPGKFSFTMNGKSAFIQKDHRYGHISFNLNVPTGATPRWDLAYVFWGGIAYEEIGYNTIPDVDITAGGQTISNVVGTRYYKIGGGNQASGMSSDSYVSLPGALNNISNTTSTGSTPVTITFMDCGEDNNCGARDIRPYTLYIGAGIILPYEDPSLKTDQKIIIKPFGYQVYFTGDTDDKETLNLTLDGIDLSLAPTKFKAGFFFGEIEYQPGTERGAECRPAYIQYNNQTLNPTSDICLQGAQGALGTKLQKASDGMHWDTRITGEDLPEISTSSKNVSFTAISPGKAIEEHGESFTFMVAAVAYPVVPPLEPKPTPTLPPMPKNCNDECISRGYESGYCDSAVVYPGESVCEANEVNIGQTEDCFVPLGQLGVNRACCCRLAPTQVLTCTDLTSTPDASGLSPQDKITLTCAGTATPDPINHFEFRVSVDEGTPTSLPNASATKTDSEYKGEISYTIPDYGCYKIECRACVSTDSSNCTIWGQVGKTLLTK